MIGSVWENGWEIVMNPTIRSQLFNAASESVGTVLSYQEYERGLSYSRDWRPPQQNNEHETMPTQPPARLEFTDCLACGKRVATTAPVCRHCNTKRAASKVALSIEKLRGPVNQERELDDDVDSHAALGLGGYGHDDWDEAKELNEPPSKTKTLWWYVALVLLIVFALGALWPLF